jgi:ribosomal RNA-processing protein 17
LREERKQELEEHVEAVNRLLQDMEEPTSLGLEDDGDWEGIKDEKPLIAAVEAVDREEEYVDEDRYTVVTVEAVDVTKDGLSKVEADESDTEQAPVLVKRTETPKKVWPKKVLKKKFTYETKTERKLARGKQKAGNKARADARRGNG